MGWDRALWARVRRLILVRLEKLCFLVFFVLNKASFCLIRFDNNEHNFWFKARLDYTYYSAFFCVCVCV